MVQEGRGMPNPRRKGQGCFPEQSDKEGYCRTGRRQAGRGKQSLERVNDRGHSTVLQVGEHPWGGAVRWPWSRAKCRGMDCTWGGASATEQLQGWGPSGLEGISPVICVYD